MCILCILIPILVGLVCALLGYFLGRQIEKKSEVEEYLKEKNIIYSGKNTEFSIRKVLNQFMNRETIKDYTEERVYKNLLSILEEQNSAIKKLTEDFIVKKIKKELNQLKDYKMKIVAEKIKIDDIINKGIL